MTTDRTGWRSVLLVVVVAAWALPAAAQPAGGPDPAIAPDDLEKCKDVAPWLSLNGDVRFRTIFAPNMFLDKEDRHWQSYRGRIGATVKPCEDLRFNMQLVYEPMHYFAPDRELYVDHAGIIDNWVQNEAVFDTFNIQWKNVLKLPVTLTVGRQALIFGNGWLVLDGTPYDQSRTIFFDAVRTTVDFKNARPPSTWSTSTSAPAPTPTCPPSASPTSPIPNRMSRASSSTPATPP